MLRFNLNNANFDYFSLVASFTTSPGLPYDDV